jgi:hypothetical protein
MNTHQNAQDARSAPIMRPAGIGHIANPAPVCAKPKGEKRPSMREVALSVLARLANSGRREW